MSFAGFDLERTDALARELRRACDQAATLSRAIAATLDEAHEVLLTAGGGSAPGGPWSTGHDAQRLGLTTLARDGAPRADELERRAKHLRAGDELVRDGFWVSPTQAFADSPPPDAAAIRRVLAELRAASGDDTGWNGNHDELTAALEHLGALGDEELDSVLMSLTDEDYAKLDAAMRPGEPLTIRNFRNDLDADRMRLSEGSARFEAANHRGEVLFARSGLDRDELIQLGSNILPRASATAVLRVSRALPVLQPSFGDLKTEVPGVYMWAGPISTDGADLEDINQGFVGDCWFLAGLGAELHANPSFVTDRLKDNGNGTWTVTFYRDGKPVPVTVDSSLPAMVNNGPADDWYPLFARGPGVAKAPNWVSIYEKAFARFEGSYGEIENGFGARSMEALTGHHADRLLDWPGAASQLPSLVEVKDLLDAGRPVTVGTRDDGSLWWFGPDDEDHRVYDGNLVSHHEYVVTKVEYTGHGLRITLRNPWGNPDEAPEFVELGEDTYRQWFKEVSVR